MNGIRGISVVALIVGVVIDRVGAFVGVMCVLVIVTISGGSFTDPMKDLSELIPILSLATLATLLAGFLAARIARRHHALHGLLVGVLAVGLSWLTTTHGGMPTWLKVGNVIVTPLAAMAGGSLAARKAHNVRHEPAA